MKFIQTHWFPILLLSAWLPFTTTLWPIPTENRASQASSTLLSLAKQGEGARKSYMDEKERREFNSDVELLSDPQNILMEWRINWATHAFVLLLGLVSILLVARRIRGWRIGLIVASVCYLALVTDFSLLRIINIEQWKIWWMLATEYSVSTAYLAAAFQFFHVILLTFLISRIFISVRKPASENN